MEVSLQARLCSVTMTTCKSLSSLMAALIEHKSPEDVLDTAPCPLSRAQLLAHCGARPARGLPTRPQVLAVLPRGRLPLLPDHRLQPLRARQLPRVSCCAAHTLPGVRSPSLIPQCFETPDGLALSGSSPRAGMQEQAITSKAHSWRMLVRTLGRCHGDAAERPRGGPLLVAHV